MHDTRTERERMSAGLRLAATCLSVCLALVCASQARADIIVAEVVEAIQPITARYLLNAIDTAEKENASLLIVRLNTPGGLMQSMRAIIERIINARVPVAVYVAPSGARAASAGFMITISADVAAMSPGTNMGAAHPVGVGNPKIDEIMSKKIENDTVAWIKSIAEKRGRNTELADKAVRESKSYTEREALEGHLIEHVCQSVDDLVSQLDGKSIRRFDGSTVVLRLAGQQQRWIEMSQKEKFLNFIADPSIAYLLFIAALVCLYIEFTTPGAIFPGVAGGICLILALFAFDILPINYAALLLILLAFALFVAEVKVQSFGVLGVGGIIALIIGSLMLFDSPDASLRVPLGLVLSVSFGVAAITIFLLKLSLSALRARTVTGEQGIIGEVGVVIDAIRASGEYPPGKIRAHGELWDAVSVEGEIRNGERAEVVAIDGLILTVKRVAR